MTVLLECHTDCSIRVSRSFENFPMAESDPAKTGLAGPLAMALMTLDKHTTDPMATPILDYIHRGTAMMFQTYAL